MTESHLGAVACGHPLTAAAAVEILQEGGNAFDAVVAAQFVACVVEPVLTSLGGGGFLLAATTDTPPTVYDFFAQSPIARRSSSEEPAALYPIEADFGATTQTFHIGPGSMATPGTVAGMFAVHRQLCSLPMARLMEPAIKAARAGVLMNDFQGYIFDIVRPIYRETDWAEARTGTLLCQPQLADSLEALARDGERLFYQGELGARLLKLCRDQGGHLTEADLKNYQVIKRSPLSINYRDHRIFTNPLPSAGGVLIGHALNQLDAVTCDPLAILKAMESANIERPRLLDHSDQVSRGTTHISVIDAAGNIAAMTLSNGEGSGCAIPGTGIMMNNMLGEEDINPRGIGRWLPDRRLGSMMAPTLVVAEQTRYALGSGGSNRIRSAILQVVCALLDRQLSPSQAVDAPRLHLEQRFLSLEPGFDPATVSALQNQVDAMQQWQATNLFFGGVHLVAGYADGSFEAAGDHRRGGEGRLA